MEQSKSDKKESSAQAKAQANAEKKESNAQAKAEAKIAKKEAKEQAKIVKKEAKEQVQVKVKDADNMEVVVQSDTDKHEIFKVPQFDFHFRYMSRKIQSPCYLNDAPVVAAVSITKDEETVLSKVAKKEAKEQVKAIKKEAIEMAKAVKAAMKQYNKKEWDVNHRQKRVEYSQKWTDKNPEVYKAYQKQYRLKKKQEKLDDKTIL